MKQKLPILGIVMLNEYVIGRLLVIFTNEIKFMRNPKLIQLAFIIIRYLVLLFAHPIVHDFGYLLTVATVLIQSHIHKLHPFNSCVY